MGKKRLADEQKVDAFVAEINQWAKERGGYGINMSKRVKKQLIHLARRDNKSIERVLEEFRPVAEKICLNPQEVKPLSEWSDEEYACYLKRTGKLN
ncbi:MAG TPA: hypothetical protein VJJ20_01730 [Candidatus Paceibacterota bacterium]